MIESEVKVFDSKIDLQPIDARKADIELSSFEKVDITSTNEEVRRNDQTPFVRGRKIRRMKSAGIF